MMKKQQCTASVKSKPGNQFQKLFVKEVMCGALQTSLATLMLQTQLQQINSAEAEGVCVVYADGEIIADDLHWMLPSYNMFQDVESCISNSLLRLLEIVIAKATKHATKDQWIKKCTEIAHCIISVAKQKSFLSPLQHLFTRNMSNNQHFKLNIFL